MEEKQKKERNTFGVEVKIKELNLDNFRGFGVLKNLVFDERVTVLIAENGGGKTTILDAIASALQIFLNQLLKFNYTPLPSFSAKNIKNGTENGGVELIIDGQISSLHANVENEEQEENSSEPEKEEEYHKVPILESKLQISINKEKTACKISEYAADEESEFTFRELFEEQFRPEIDYLPVLVYYGGNSIDTNAELVVPLRENSLYHIYSGCLDARRFSFDSFLRWFDTLYKMNIHKSEDEKSRELTIIEEVVYRILNEGKEQEKWMFSNLRMHYTLEHDTLRIDKKNANGQTEFIEVDQMSAGEKVMFAIAADIAKRLMLANPDLLNNWDETPLTGQGVVLIDEIDLHLHPKWQRLILPKLVDLFPNVQFVVTTHSPFVLQSIKVDYSTIISLKNNTANKIENAFHYGRDATSISFDMQGVSRRLPEVQKEIDFMYQLIDGGKVEEAKSQIKKLAQNLSGSDEDILKAITILKFLEDDSN